MKIGILAKVKGWADKKNEQIFFQDQFVLSF
jgi:hypothetical protein